MPMRTLNFDNKDVERILRETHELAVWVVNQDELLDRRLLEQKEVKVIRYIQSATQGRNLIISSKARDTLLVNSLKERLAAILPQGTAPEVIPALVQRLINDANAISGGLVLKAARRANNTSELFGMVLSRYLVQSELGIERPAAWCFLDDYSHWLGKKEGANIADLLILAPTYTVEGKPHLDIIVTEAKFVSSEGVSVARNTSEKQLADTLVQISQALTTDPKALDQELWLARLSDMILSRTIGTAGAASFDPETWRSFVRNRECTFSVWGYSHVFVHSTVDIQVQVSTCKGISTQQAGPGLQGLQEVFGPDLTRSLLLHLHGNKSDETTHLRTQNGHPGFNTKLVRDLAVKLKKASAAVPKENDAHEPADSEGTVISEAASPKPPGPKEPSDPVEKDRKETAQGSQEAAQAIASDDPHEALMKYLEHSACKSTTSIAEGQLWLEKTTAALKQALLSRGLSAKLSEGFAPILTPNAAIIKLQGSKDMTVQAVETRTEEIFTSDGVKIISTKPESGRVSIAVARPEREILHTTSALHKVLSLHPEAGAEEKVFVGLREEDGSPIFIDPFQQPHTLVAGATNSGKSVLLQNIILGIVTTRTPDESKIALIDPKLGSDYADLARLPHFIKDYGNVITDPQDAIKCLESMVNEMEDRYKLFAEAGLGINNIKSYRKKTGKNLPTIWLIHDEFPDWMQMDEYREAVTSPVNRLSVKARAAGIYLIFAAQRPDNSVFPMQFRNQLGNKLVLRVAEAGTSVIALGEEGAEKLLGHGHMLAKVGLSPDPVFAQVPFIDTSEGIPDLVEFMLKLKPIQ